MLARNDNLSKKDLIYNYGSLAFLLLSGISLNILIGLNYEPSTLGVFNQVITIYIIFSMIGSFGIQFSVLQSVAANFEKKEKLKSIILGGLILVFITSILTTIIYLLSINPISKLLDSKSLKEGMLFISPGLFLFSINKVLLNGVINGLNKMQMFAILQSIRYLIIFLTLVFAILLSLKGSALTIIFSVSEIILFIVLLFLLNKIIRWWEGKFFFQWVKRHFIFGYKSFFGGILLELNSRIDILMIGFFLSDTEVGIYSFSALFAEGFYQIFIVLQNIYNPILSNEIDKDNKTKINSFIKKSFSKSYKFFIPLGILSIVIYPYFLKLITNNEIYLQSISSFIVLVSAITLASGYLPFYNIFYMGDLPSFQSIFLFSIVILNIIGNYILIPIFGIIGAAIGTGFSIVASISIFKYLTNKKLGLNL